jgi:hypothetical protein
MYPAAALVASLYSYEDLPDAIDVGGIEYTKLDPPESVGGFTRYYINANDEYLGILEGEGEDSLWTYEGGGGPCLINAFNGEGGEREDQFADTYTVSGNPDFDQTVARTSLGFWIGQGTEVQESNATVFYMRCSNLRIAYSESDWDAWWMTLGASDTIAKKTGDQNTPEGSYPFSDIIGTMTVS